MFDPDIVIEMFVFDSAGSKANREATAEGQIHDDAIGEATDLDALDSPVRRRAVTPSGRSTT